ASYLLIHSYIALRDLHSFPTRRSSDLYEALKMRGRPSERVTPLMISAMRMAWSSLSITHGPAMRKRLPPPMTALPTWKPSPTVSSFAFLVSSKQKGGNLIIDHGWYSEPNPS